MSRWLGDSDEALAAVVSEIKALPNVRTVDAPDDAINALRALGVAPRVAYSEPNDRLLTMARLDREENILYTFTHSYKFAVCKGKPAADYVLEMEGTGAPYQIDPWTGKVEKLGCYVHKNGRTCVKVTLAPGECALLALDLSDQETVSIAAPAPCAVPTTIVIDRFDITVEDWNEGEKVVNTEEKFGHVTTEVYYTTRKTPLTFKDSALVPWKDLPATEEQLAQIVGDMSNVSGVAFYAAEFELPEDWNRTLGALLKLENANSGSVQVTVNGKTLPVDYRALTSDISEAVKPGKNTLVIEVASTLNNRLVQRGFIRGKGAETSLYPSEVHDYGLTGKAMILPYQMAEIG